MNTMRVCKSHTESQICQQLIWLNRHGARGRTCTQNRGKRMRRRDDRFWTSTRGQLLILLRRGIDTVNDLAAAIGLTDNAIRSHLTALERDGLVRPSGTRRGPRKPTVTYALTPEA